MAIKWVFFDVGDVLFDEDVQHMYWYHSILLAMRRNGVEVEWDEYHQGIQDCVRVKPHTAITDAARRYVTDDALWGEDISGGPRRVPGDAKAPLPTDFC